MDLSGKSAIVTGSGSGIGRQIASTLAIQGASVTIADFNFQGAAETLRRIEESGGTARAVETDVSDSGQVDDLVASTAAAYGAVDILVNNAGFGFNSRIVDMLEEDWDRVLAVNLKGQFLCSRAAARLMIEQRSGGRIVNIASTAAANARYEGGAYCAAKAGVVQLTKVLAPWNWDPAASLLTPWDRGLPRPKAPRNHQKSTAPTSWPKSLPGGRDSPPTSPTPYSFSLPLLPATLTARWFTWMAAIPPGNSRSEVKPKSPQERVG